MLLPVSTCVASLTWQSWQKSLSFLTDIPLRYYESTTDLVDAINWKLQNAQMPDNLNFNIGKHLVFSYYPHYHRVGIEIDFDNINFIEISDSLRHILGFSKTSLWNKTTWAENVPDIYNGFETLYIYCSIVEPQIARDVMAPLLRTVKTEGKNLEIVDRMLRRQTVLYLT